MRKSAHLCRANRKALRPSRAHWVKTECAWLFGWSTGQRVKDEVGRPSWPMEGATALITWFGFELVWGEGPPCNSILLSIISDGCCSEYTGFNQSMIKVSSLLERVIVKDGYRFSITRNESALNGGYRNLFHRTNTRVKIFN